MQYIAAFFSAVGFVGTCIGIYAFYSNHPGPAVQKNKMLLGIITAIFLLTFIFASLSALGVKGVIGSTLSPINNGQLEANSPKQMTSTAISTPTPSPTATATPSPTPTLAPKSGTVLYQADWSNGMNGWTGSSDWQTYNGMLINDGSSTHVYGGYQATILAPFQVKGTSDYAVVARIQVVQYVGCCDSYFGIFARGSSTDNGWKGYLAGVGYNTMTVEQKQSPFSPGTAWHIYRMEVQGEIIRFSVDGGITLETTDTTYLQGGQIGLSCYDAKINVSSLEVVAL